MLSQEVIEKLADRLVKRVEEANTFTLKTIAKQLRIIGKQSDLRPTEINKLVNLLKYGGDYDKIKKELAKMSKLNQKDIDKIFKLTAKRNQDFAKQFYDYRNIKYIPLEENTALLRKVNAIADMTKKTYKNIGNTRAIGFSIMKNNEMKFVPLKKMYQDVIDRGILAISQSKDTFNNEYIRIIKELSSSGLKMVEFESGYHRRLDSQVRMNLMDGLRQMTNEVNEEFGKQFHADGVEITVHINPAPDHANVQGHQFRNEEFNKFQNDEDCVDVNNVEFKAKWDDKHDRRSISQYNCYHNAFPIIIGISKPIYSDKQLKEIIDDSKKKIKFEGKEFTKYEASQYQRKIETALRKLKDRFNMFNEEDKDSKLYNNTKKKIKYLTAKYKQLTAISGLPNRLDRARTYNRST